MRGGADSLVSGAAPAVRSGTNRVGGLGVLLVLSLTVLSCEGDAGAPLGPAPQPTPPPVTPSAPNTVTLTVDPPQVREGAGAVRLTVTGTWLGAGTRPTVTAIALTVDPNTAIAADYTATQATLSIPAGRTSGTAALTLTAVSDVMLEGAETVTVNGTAEGITIEGVDVTINDPPVVVFFGVSQLEIPEGASRDIAVHYQVAELTTALDVGISFLGGSASTTDFRVSAESVRIPPGRNLEGAVELSLTATTDRTVTEGDESLTVRFVRPSGINASLIEFGPALEVVIEDRGSPCPGTLVWGDPPRRTESVLQVALVMDWAQQAGGGFDWAGPYYDDEDDPDERRLFPYLEVNVADWRVETSDGSTRHMLELEWPSFLAMGLIFHSDRSSCDRPNLVCRSGGCELRP